MMIRGWFVAGLALFTLVIFLDSGPACGGKNPVAIKVVMKRAMAGDLTKKVANGKASEDEKRELVALFTDLAAHKNPKGDPQDWTERTQALLKAVKADDTVALKKALDCGGCHNGHK